LLQGVANYVCCHTDVLSEVKAFPGRKLPGIAGWFKKAHRVSFVVANILCSSNKKNGMEWFA
jgi:hypothetical protein